MLPRRFRLEKTFLFSFECFEKRRNQLTGYHPVATCTFLWSHTVCIFTNLKNRERNINRNIIFYWANQMAFRECSTLCYISGFVATDF